MKIRCFLLEPTASVRVSLRRFTFVGDKRCRLSPVGGHETGLFVTVPVAPAADWPGASGDPFAIGAPIAKDDPRWPEECSYCREPFQVDDPYQVHVEGLWAGSPNGELVTLRNAPAGALWNAEWFPERGPDGRSLCLQLPGGSAWHIDGPSARQLADVTAPRFAPGRPAAWQRWGAVPKITVTPSVLTPGFHGVVKDGYLESV